MLRWLTINKYRPGAIELPRAMDVGPDVPVGRFQILQHRVEEAIQIKDQDGNTWDGVGWNWEDVPIETEEPGE